MADLVLAGQAALITGGGSGIGLACGAAPLRDGASVTIAGRSQERLDAAVAELQAEAPDGRGGARRSPATSPTRTTSPRRSPPPSEVTGGLQHCVASAGHRHGRPGRRPAGGGVASA